MNKKAWTIVVLQSLVILFLIAYANIKATEADKMNFLSREKTYDIRKENINNMKKISSLKSELDKCRKRNK